jgi:PKD repeat protein
LRQVLDIIDDDTTDGTSTVTPPPQQQQPIRLTNNNASEASPSWSPDGERIAFSSDRDDNSEIYLMNADDGSEQTRLTEESQFDGYPRWSPDGEKIAFDSNRGNQRGIFVMNAVDGSDVTPLTDDGNGPAWSPDGEKIAFTSDRDAAEDSDQNAIYVMNSTGADSGNATRLTDPDSYYEDLDWSASSASTPGSGIGMGSNATNNTGGGNTTEPLTILIGVDIDQPATPTVVFEAHIEGGAPPYTCHWDLGDGTTGDETDVSDFCGPSYIYRDPGEYTVTFTVTDSVGQTASDSTELGVDLPSGNQVIGGTNTEGIPSNIHPPVIYELIDETVQATSPEGAPVSFNELRALEYYDGEINRVPVSCDHESGEIFPIGETVVTCTAIGTEVELGQRYTTQESFTITVVEEDEGLPAVADDGVTEQPPTDTVEEVPPAADDGEAAETPTNSTGGL